MPFSFKKLAIPEVLLIEPAVFPDTRGAFAELYKYPDFFRAGIPKQIVQINYSRSDRYVLRGLHYQKNPMAQGKIMSVLSGEIFDVAVDIRQGSPSYRKWVCETLSSANMKMLYIPEGFAHGFCVLSEKAEITYQCTNTYSPEHERGILWNDPDLAIPWPLNHPLLSEKDGRFPPLKNADNNFVYGM
ncbi:MAG: dTDP-4-dehydrorhamnose 3,5-epimerase [Candidatus Brocadia sp.]|jgi:dTDP-4-dehydrorhamnose 3,5-epimerase (EC 5.1.3.13)|uniref:dTDP-4-dehydrorhamnose 3,5-epimerase n=1 Tax=Candidatus Brocadia fulgida TaxID=380242 RepID=A0A0M2UX79_9BACT|nr:MAG: dTDP-4-deoxyrhamnose 3,5 epimerase [Candidatus Brocadia fulgida]UJS19882.1 MAG: dTDP-4-dehydrorhamnose 3,5-epimerase [Candidatus Brocadia sp.]